MYPRSAAFDAASQLSHRMATKVEVRDYSGVLLSTISPYIDGNITVADDGQSSRRTADLTLTDPTGSLVINALGQLLAPVTNEVWMYRGIAYPNGTTELINLGVFVITDHIVDDSGEGFQIRLSMKDRVHRIQAAPLINDITFPSGTTYVSAITQMIQAVLPSAPMNFDQDTSQMGTTVFEAGFDRWKICQQFAAAIGCTLFFDVYGVCQLNKIPNFPTAPSLWTYRDGPGGTMLYLNKRTTDDGFSNHVVVVGNSPSGQTAVRAEVYDGNPQSFTYIGGKYGDRVNVIRDSSIKDQSVAATRAQAELQLGLGFAELIYISAIVFPVFELYDVVTVIRADSKVSGRYSISQMSYPMTNDRPMYLTFAKRLVNA